MPSKRPSAEKPEPTKLTQARLDALLKELQETAHAGILALSFPTPEDGLCIWWGNRSVALGYAARLSYGINCDMDEDEQNEEPHPEFQTGQYL